MPALRAPLLVAHCDWSTQEGKRWMAVGSVGQDGLVRAGAPEKVGDPTALLASLQHRAQGAGVLVGFDFPIGVPRAYADRAGITRLPDFLRGLAAQDRPELFAPAQHADEVSVDRPFYPQRPGSARQQHLVDGLGVDDMTALLRHCERRSPTRRAASSLFWLVGGAQVGKAAIAGWRDVLLPAIGSGARVGIWPFDGSLAETLEAYDVVVAETYPTELATHLGAQPGAGGKRQRGGRSPACRAAEDAAAALGVTLSDAAAAELADDFGDRPDGEDRFDAFIGLVGMLNIALGHRDAGPPPAVAPDTIAVEGWILGQLTAGDVPATADVPAAAPPPRRGYALAPDEGVDGRGPEVKCSHRSTGGSLALYRTIVDGEGAPPHRHTHEDETIVVLDGTMQVECGEDTWTGGTGTTFFLPRGLTHTFRSLDGPASILFLITPGRLDEFFRLREEVSDPAEVAELARRFF